jgi:hypothetical protein
MSEIGNEGISTDESSGEGPIVPEGSGILWKKRKKKNWPHISSSVWLVLIFGLFLFILLICGLVVSFIKLPWWGSWSIFIVYNGFPCLVVYCLNLFFNFKNFPVYFFWGFQDLCQICHLIIFGIAGINGWILWATILILVISIIVLSAFDYFLLWLKSEISFLAKS